MRAQMVLANSDAELGNTEKALDEAREAARRAPQNPAPYVPIGLLQEKTQQLSAAEQSVRKATSLDPKFFMARLALGDFYQRHQRWPEAEIEYRAAIEIDPHSAVARASLASHYLALGRKDKAEQT